MRSEERRALVLLGITAVFASILGVVLSLVWSGQKTIDDFYFNVPPVSSPIPHATYNWYYILEFVVIFWLLYAFCAFWYFCEDWLRFHPTFRKRSHFLAIVFAGFYILYIVAFIPLTYVVVVLITNQTLQGFVYVYGLVFIGVLEGDFVQFARGKGYRALTYRLVKAIRRRVKREKLPDWNEESIAI
jgi:hypothetical protein